VVLFASHQIEQTRILIERAKIGEFDLLLFKDTVQSLLRKGIDVLILGCTEISHMYSAFRELRIEKITVYDTNEILAQSIVNYYRRLKNA
jgi:aspartate/glutamate racemase